MGVSTGRAWDRHGIPQDKVENDAIGDENGQQRPKQGVRHTPAAGIAVDIPDQEDEHTKERQRYQHDQGERQDRYRPGAIHQKRHADNQRH
jgi:hypothetical protein